MNVALAWGGVREAGEATTRIALAVNARPGARSDVRVRCQDSNSGACDVAAKLVHIGFLAATKNAVKSMVDGHIRANPLLGTILPSKDVW